MFPLQLACEKCLVAFFTHTLWLCLLPRLTLFELMVSFAPRGSREKLSLSLPPAWPPQYIRSLSLAGVLLQLPLLNPVTLLSSFGPAPVVLWIGCVLRSHLEGGEAS